MMGAQRGTLVGGLVSLPKISRYFADLADLGPKPASVRLGSVLSSQSEPGKLIDDFHGVSPGN